jgi:hypothetical protein
VIRGKKVWRSFRQTSHYGCTKRERLAFEAGRRFRVRHGAMPWWLSRDKMSDDWNGYAPYCKRLRVPSKGGFVAYRWSRYQREREAWELGWAFENKRWERTK